MVNEDACIEFLCKYGKGELTDSINRFCIGDVDLLTKYNNWLEWKNTNNINFGGRPEHIISKLFDVNETIFIYEWGDLEGWPELFTYLYNLSKNKTHEKSI